MKQMKARLARGFSDRGTAGHPVLSSKDKIAIRNKHTHHITRAPYLMARQLCQQKKNCPECHCGGGTLGKKLWKDFSPCKAEAKLSI